MIYRVRRSKNMTRERARQIVLALAGLFYLALLYPLCSDLWHSHWLVDMNSNDCEPMFLSFYVGLGLFLLLAVRKPSRASLPHCLRRMVKPTPCLGNGNRNAGSLEPRSSPRLQRCGYCRHSW